MLYLKLFGGVAVEGPAGPLSGRAVQRHRLALLAILATCQARGRGSSREKLIAYLWPEADPERGRPLLSDSVYRINQAVGGEAIVAVGEELRLVDGMVSSDVADFERAVESGDRERAALLYAGPLVDGVYLVDGTEFERWLEGERTRLAGGYAETLDHLAQAAESKGAMADAVTWWRRLASHDPYSSRVAVALMEALAMVGDPGAAVRHAAIHTALLEHDLGVAPNASVVRLAERLKADRVESGISTSTVREPIADAAVTPPPDETALPLMPAGSVPNDERLPSSVVIAGRRRRLSIEVSAAVAFALALAAVIALGVWRGSAQVSNAPPGSIAVLPFTDLSPGHDNAYFSDGIAEEVINSLTQVEGVRVAARTSAFAFRDGRADVREVGRRLGVATVLEGCVRKSGGKLRITVQLVNASDGFQLWSRSYDRQLDDVFAIQEDVSKSIVAMVRGRILPLVPDGIAEASTPRSAHAYEKRSPARTAPVPEVPNTLESGEP
ncbi:MAG TPA: BTAD domain-containing putative transcriptional regulator [Gemmatimonadaceae bacterium]|jgi:TolB-like protein/DNA-binding SARP family transcriptional activator|nr:BTAD domain-containing putative transcriptional regulator [Gemmatimonadaceae bacterium]